MLSDLWGWMTAQVERIDNPKALILICLVSYPLCALMLFACQGGNIFAGVGVTWPPFGVLGASTC